MLMRFTSEATSSQEDMVSLLWWAFRVAHQAVTASRLRQAPKLLPSPRRPASKLNIETDSECCPLFTSKLSLNSLSRASVGDHSNKNSYLALLTICQALVFKPESGPELKDDRWEMIGFERTKSIKATLCGSLGDEKVPYRKRGKQSRLGCPSARCRSARINPRSRRVNRSSLIGHHILYGLDFFQRSSKTMLASG
ncbi:uncharacterized protein BJX67DRAFT_342591 [Aspergillus lucknowensis]|uniref:Transcription factor domain-containing protein n=1 Tax=Aspergillus lucknowensis TaxID=176173 RepID=A0ABR4M4M6_9EURO